MLGLGLGLGLGLVRVPKMNANGLLKKTVDHRPKTSPDWVPRP